MDDNDIEVNGDRNRVAGRDLIKIKGNNGSINFGTQLNIDTRNEPRDLVPAQRQALYDLSLKCVELGGDSKEIWRRVFAELGVKQIDDITVEQFSQARRVLQARLDQFQDEDDKRRLIGKILRAAAEKGAKAELNNFCDVTFGRTHLNSLLRVDLQRALEFIQGFQIESMAAVSTEHELPKVLPLRDFLIIHRINAAGLFVSGIIVGGVWF